MEKSTVIGKNRTGMYRSPIHGRQMMEGADTLTELAAPSCYNLTAIEKQYISKANAIGSVPVPATTRGVLKTAREKFRGHNPEVFINKLGARLAYERAAVRLYQSVINKCELADTRVLSTGLVNLDELKHFRDQEAEHFALLTDALKALGADPTAQTPDADIGGVAAAGIKQVLSDPRTTVAQCLEVLLTLERTDSAAWDLLIKLAADLGQDEMCEQFRQASLQEEHHLLRVRAWYENVTLAEVKKLAS